MANTTTVSRFIGLMNRFPNVEAGGGGKSYCKD